MRSTLLSLIFATLAFGQGDYFPLQVGNQWVYRSAGRLSSATYALDIREIRNVKGTDYFVLVGLPGAPLLLRKTADESLVVLNESSGEERVWVAFSAATGTPFETGIDSCSPTAKITSREATLRSPIGDFTNGLQVQYGPGPCADAGFISETYLPEVGLAERRATSFAGEIKLELIYARVGGFTVISEKELSFAATLNANSVPSGDSVTVRMTLRSTQQQPVPMTFPSGQDYDVAITNDKGEEVYRWSKGRAFTLIFRTLQFSGERNWAVLIPTEGLAPGNYKLTANLASDPKFEATLPLTIEK